MAGTIAGTGWRVISNQVSVVKDSANAHAGSSNFLALADGIISNAIPTIPGAKYTLTYAYRGPGIVGLWRGENNPNDSISANNGTLQSGANYALGEVGQGLSIV